MPVGPTSLQDGTLGFELPALSASCEPWGHDNRFAGEIRGFEIWRSPITPEWMQALQQSGPRN